MCNNGGRIQGGAFIEGSCAGGLIGCTEGYESLRIQNSTNIGVVFGKNYDYVGGVVGRMNSNSFLFHCVNAGMVVGGLTAVGGIAGNVNGAFVRNSINTNRVEKSGSRYFGSIVGENYGIVSYCYNDNQMCTYGGINNIDI
jgi:hypothetical protein